MDKVKVAFKMLIDSKIQTEFTTMGEIDDNQLTFSDQKQNVYRIQLNKDELYLHRTGPEELVIVFRKEEKTGGTLKAEGFEFVMNVYTNQLDILAQELKINYDLLDGNKQVSNHQLLVKWNQYTEGND
ncbi:MAG: DUF1934 family protein [Bacilli bacterium]|nr:DUF1934 family protein [Bacilli bacterium]